MFRALLEIFTTKFINICYDNNDSIYDNNTEIWLDKKKFKDIKTEIKTNINNYKLIKKKKYNNDDKVNLINNNTNDEIYYNSEESDYMYDIITKEDLE